VIVDRILLPDRFFPGLVETQVSERRTTLYQLYQDSFGVGVLRTEERLDAGGADMEVARLLSIAPGTPVLHIVRRAFSFENKVVELRHSWVLTDDHDYFAGDHTSGNTASGQ
jgi:GntR family transcriptional regulator